MITSRGVGTELIPQTFSHTMQSNRVTHVKCSSSQSIIQREGRKSWQLEKTRRHNQFHWLPMEQEEWRNSFTKNNPLRVKLKLNINAVKRKQANTIQWHQFPGVPGILLTTQRQGCLHALTSPLKVLWNKKVFPLQTPICAIEQTWGVGTVITITGILILNHIWWELDPFSYYNPLLRKA